MFESINPVSSEERDLWLKRQRRGKLSFLLVQILTFGAPFFTVVAFAPGVLFNVHPYGKAGILLVACASLLYSYLWGEALWRKGLRITSTTDTTE